MSQVYNQTRLCMLETNQNSKLQCTLVVFHREAIYFIMAHASMRWNWFDRSNLMSDPEN
jgi:hypothetical protein